MQSSRKRPARAVESDREDVQVLPPKRPRIEQARRQQKDREGENSFCTKRQFTD
jgi:hypothetical protein